VSGPLRSSPAIEQALARARDFVESRGGVLARERLYVLLGEAAPERVEAVLAAWRCADGGFARVSQPPPLLPGCGTLRGALEALAILDEAGRRRGPLLEGLVAWLGSTQREDGVWRAVAEDRLPPAQEDPVVLTGMLAGQLSKLSCGSSRTLERAEHFLASHFSPERVEASDGLGLMAYAPLCSNGSFELADEVLQWCGRALEKGFRSGLLDALAVAHTLLLCDVRALPGGRVDAQEVLLALLPAQHADGSFGSGGSSTPERVEDTLLGVRALVRFGIQGAAWIPA